jgi:phage gp29-like protein
MADKQKIGALLKPGTLPAANELNTRVAAPAIVYATEAPTGSVRRAIDASVPDMSTPLATMAQLNRARNGDTRALVDVVEPIVQQDLNYSAAVDTVIEALTSAMLIAEPAGELARDKRVAADVQRYVLDSDVVMGIVEHLASVDDFGYCAAEVIWDTSSPRWIISNVIPLSPAWVSFDKNDARTPMLAPDVSGGTPQPLRWGKFVYCALPGYGLPYLRSHGYAAALFKALGNMGVKDWAGYLEMFGQPMRKGTYDPEAMADKVELEKAKKVLKTALQNLASDAWAMLPKGLEIELLEATTTGMSSDLYERFVRYTDEMITKRKTGSVLATGTGNTGSGGTQALGAVHNEALLRKVRSLGRRVAAAIRRFLVEPYVRFNYGEDTPIPFVTFSFEEQEDVAGLSDALAKLVPLGLRVSQEEVRDRLGLRAPVAGEELLGAPVVPDPAATPAISTAQQHTAHFAATQDDDLDALIAELQAEDGYIAAEAEADDAILAAIEGATDIEALKAALIQAVKTGQVGGMQAVLTAGATAARVSGDLGAILGDA